MSARSLLGRTLAAIDGSNYLTRIAFAVEHAAEGAARARLRPNAANANTAGAVHGGAIASVMLGASELAAASSERERQDGELHVSTLAVSFLDAANAADEIVAAADVVRRGRDVVHVRVEARRPDDDAPLAAALASYRVSDAGEPVRAPASARAAGVRVGAGRLAGSPYMGAGGAEMLARSADAGIQDEWACMALPLARNEGASGRIHDGAIIGLVDTCAALAAFRSYGAGARPASSTVSLSMAWTSAVEGDARAGARLVGRAGGVCVSEAEVWTAADGVLRATGSVCFRMRPKRV